MPRALSSLPPPAAAPAAPAAPAAALAAAPAAATAAATAAAAAHCLLSRSRHPSVGCSATNAIRPAPPALPHLICPLSFAPPSPLLPSLLAGLSALPSELRAILPRGRIKPYTPAVAAASGSSFFWGGLARIDVLEAPLCARLTFVTAYALKVEQCREAPEAAENFYQAEVGRTLTPPLTPESAQQMGELVMKQRVELELSEMTQSADISISGLGWVSVGALASLRRSDAGMACVIEVWVPQGVQVSLRPPMPIAGLPNEPPEFEDELPTDWRHLGGGDFDDRVGLR